MDVDSIQWSKLRLSSRNRSRENRCVHRQWPSETKSGTSLSSPPTSRGRDEEGEGSFSPFFKWVYSVVGLIPRKSASDKLIKFIIRRPKSDSYTTSLPLVPDTECVNKVSTKERLRGKYEVHNSKRDPDNGPFYRDRRWRRKRTLTLNSTIMLRFIRVKVLWIDIGIKDYGKEDMAHQKLNNGNQEETTVKIL